MASSQGHDDTLAKYIDVIRGQYDRCDGIFQILTCWFILIFIFQAFGGGGGHICILNPSSTLKRCILRRFILNEDKKSPLPIINNRAADNPATLKVRATQRGNSNESSSTGDIGIWHHNDVTMGTIASQTTSLTIVYSTVYSYADQRKHQSSASLAFVRGIHRGPVNSLYKWPVTRKMFPFGDVIMVSKECVSLYARCSIDHIEPWSKWW